MKSAMPMAISLRSLVNAGGMGRSNPALFVLDRNRFQAICRSDM